MAVLRSHEARTRRQKIILAVESDGANTSSSGDVIYLPMTAVKKGFAFHSIQSTIFPLHPRALYSGILGFGVQVVSRSQSRDLSAPKGQIVDLG